jgi:DNA-binding NtrC family response regulator
MEGVGPGEMQPLPLLQRRREAEWSTWLPTSTAGTKISCCTGGEYVAQRILVVDDEPHIRYMIQTVLLEEHYDVETAGSVLEALAKLEDSPFDLAIVDLCLPDITGLDLAEAIRMLDPGTPVILITAYGTPVFEFISSHPAISHYVHKPFVLDRLLSLVREMMPRGSMPVSSEADLDPPTRRN